MSQLEESYVLGLDDLDYDGLGFAQGEEMPLVGLDPRHKT